MNTISKKRIYCTPFIERIKLDNEISLVLESAGSDPGEPGTFSSNATEYFNNDPFKINIG